ncbi:hypothetical protein Tco_0920851, partial [Tanacetum coccineum]
HDARGSVCICGCRFPGPPSPDYVPDPDEPKQAPLSPKFVPEPVYPEFMPSVDDVLPAEEKPLPAAVSPTADSPGYIADSDPEEDPKEDPTDYPADRGDDDDDESSDGNEDDDDDVEEEEEHPAPTNSVLPLIHCVTARMSIQDEPPTPFWSEAETARLLAIQLPPPSSLSSWLSPLPQIPSPPLPVSPSLPISPPLLPASPTYPLGYRAAMIRQRAESPSTSHSLPLPPPIILSHIRAFVAMMRAAAPSTYILASRLETPPSGIPLLLPIPLPIPSPPLLLPSTDRRADRLEVCLPYWADYVFVATLDREIRQDPERDVGYGIIDTWDKMLEGMLGAPTTHEKELGRRMNNFVTTVRQDTNEIYGRLNEAQEARAVLSGQLNLLCKHRRSHAYTVRLGDGRWILASSRPRSTVITCRDTKTDEYTADIGYSTPESVGIR